MNRINNWVDWITCPAPGVYKSDIIHQVSWSRTKTFLKFNVIQYLLVLSAILVDTKTITPLDIINASSTAFYVVITCIFSRSYPRVLSFLYTVQAIPYYLIASYYAPNRILEIWITSSTCSIFVATMSGDNYCIAISVIIQLVLVNQVIEPILTPFLTWTDPKIVSNLMVTTGGIMLVIISGLLIISNNSLNQAYKKYDETTKRELEKQKTFLLSFSHELRNPINSIMGNIELALLEPLPQQISDLISNAKVGIEFLIHLVNNILDGGKAQIDDIDIVPIPTETYSCFQKIWNLGCEFIKKRNLHGTLKMSRDLPEVILVDQNRITQILFNLIINASNFTKKGYVNLSVSWIPNKETVNEECFMPYPYDETSEGIFEKDEAASMIGRWQKFSDSFVMMSEAQKTIEFPKAEIQQSCRKGILKMIVTDTGSGIPEHVKKSLFQFSQVGQNSSKLGTGLGLYITRELCKKMNGEARIFSQPNIGTTVIICIPLLTQSHEEYEKIAHPTLQSQNEVHKLKVLIVDDIEFNITVLKNYFLKLGITKIESAKNGEEAVLKYKTAFESGEPFTLVSMDVDMPIMDGKQASKEIRSFEKAYRLKPSILLIISGNCTESEIRTCLDKSGEIQADYFISKPASFEFLSRLIYRMINQRE